jgi:hypothetical protein
VDGLIISRSSDFYCILSCTLADCGGPHLAFSVMQSSFAFIVSFTSPASRAAQDEISDEGEDGGENEDEGDDADTFGFDLGASVRFCGSG